MDLLFIEHIHYNYDYFMGLFELSLANESVGDITIPTQVIKYNQCCSRQISQSDCTIHIKLIYYLINLFRSMIIDFSLHFKKIYANMLNQIETLTLLLNLEIWYLIYYIIILTNSTE